jgi:hypothetical protein
MTIANDGYIRVRLQWVPVKVTPKELENYEEQTNYRKNRRNHSFRNNPLKLVHWLCRAYGIGFKITKLNNPFMKCLWLSIPALYINFGSYGESIREAKQKLMFKLHREYCKRIVQNPSMI